MSCDNDLCELGGLIGDAADGLRRAEALALRLIGGGGGEGGDADGWPAMEELAGRLEALNRTLAGLPGPEIRSAIDRAGEDLDEMSDRADGLSY